MKKILGYSIMLLMLTIASTSCDDILDQKAVDAFDEDSVFEDINLTKAYLGNCYDHMGGDNNQMLGMREDILASATDEVLNIHRPNGIKFVKGTMSPDELGHFGNWRFSWIRWENMYSNIKNVNVLLANIDNVPASTQADKDLLERMKGEAYFLRALAYSNIMRSYGGVILIKTPFELEQDFATIKRSTLQETVDFILEDLTQAISLLPQKDGIEQGRATQGAAAALKSRVLSWCTGELVSGNYSSDPLVSFSSSRESRLQAAQSAAKAIIDGNYGTYALNGTTDDPPVDMNQACVDKYACDFYATFIQTGNWNDEVIFGVQYLSAQGNRIRPNRWFGPNGYHNWGNNNPLEPVVRSFEMKDGTPFQWDKYTPGDMNNREFTAAQLAEDPERNPYVGREPRFYASILHDGAQWQPRPSDGAGIDPEGKIQSGYYIQEPATAYFGLDQSALNEKTAAAAQMAGLDTRQGIIEAWNGTKNGYYIKKFIDEKTEGQYFDNENTWVEIRFAEVLLDYAEACIELGEVEEGLDKLNVVRNRAGLPDRLTTDQAKARDWYRHERQIEFFGEGDRWYMIRKWMIADEVIKDVHSMKIYHFSDGSKIWNYDESTAPDSRSWLESNYWLPISRTEMNKAPQLTNNPGYE